MSDEEYPSTELAYEYVSEAYRGPQARISRIEERIGSLIALVATVTIAIPTLLRGFEAPVSLADWRFVVAMILGGLTIAGGTWARNRGELRVIDPSILHERYLGLDPNEFRRHMIYWAGEHWRLNTERIARLALWHDWLTLSFLAQLGMLVWWVLG